MSCNDQTAPPLTPSPNPTLAFVPPLHACPRLQVHRVQAPHGRLQEPCRRRRHRRLGAAQRLQSLLPGGAAARATHVGRRRPQGGALAWCRRARLAGWRHACVLPLERGKLPGPPCLPAPSACRARCDCKQEGAPGWHLAACKSCCRPALTPAPATAAATAATAAGLCPALSLATQARVRIARWCDESDAADLARRGRRTGG